MKHRVSVIVPTFNTAKYLDAALQSLLRQQVDDVQIIVVDDGSTDGTPALIESYGDAIRSVRQPNRGPAAARNSGMRLAHGDYIAFIDADDLWPAGRLQRQLNHLQCDPDTDVLLGQLQYIKESAEGWTACEQPFHAMSFPSGLFRREVFELVGYLDESLRYCEDLDWFFRARQSGVGISREMEVGLLHRRHASNLTNRMDLVKKYTLQVLARHRRARLTAAR